MRFYAERPTRLARQLLADLLALGWLAGFGWLANLARDVLLALRATASGLTTAGSSIGEAFTSAAQTASRVPFVGEQLATALNRGRTAGASLAEVGAQQSETITTVATGAAALVLLVGALPVLLTWLPLRLRYARAAGAAVASRDRHADLLALRALTGLPVRRLRAVTEDPAAAWRRADPEIVRQLAALELRRLGLRGPRALSGR